ncbi:aldose 1-epimerase family protein [Streptococcus moroccensis]|uniref:Galactose mutarotase-like enzyme n=1 Tax=Streptococcus moroccensis TaxID=1451356 RepID=A0ABT9YSV7_9STRE|nr:aldose 1-epimerase family protein [Streptococcus moroccensis]MDQ0223077.1 galactose mutarotase-like enzyme [Streptococcus moroccensis]
MYYLKNDDLSIAIKPLGAELSSLKDKVGTEYLWQGDPAHWPGQAPVCFPICGSLRDGKAVTQDGKSITLGRHGLARRQNFDFLDQDKDSIRFILRDNAETCEVFPFAFELIIGYELDGKSVKTTYEVRNTGDEALPFFIGGHPAFNCPIEEGLDYKDYQLRFEHGIEPYAHKNISGGLLTRKERVLVPFEGEVLPLDQALFEDDSMAFENITAKSVSLETRSGEKVLSFDYEDFPNLVIWSSGTNAPFIALEPWTGLATFDTESDIFEEKIGVSILPVDASKRFSYTVTIA